jgi:hypothetical protein
MRKMSIASNVSIVKLEGKRLLERKRSRWNEYYNES